MESQVSSNLSVLRYILFDVQEGEACEVDDMKPVVDVFPTTGCIGNRRVNKDSTSCLHVQAVALSVSVCVCLVVSSGLLSPGHSRLVERLERASLAATRSHLWRSSNAALSSSRTPALRSPREW